MLSEDKIIMSEQTEQSKDNVKYNKFYNVALFIDYENVCKILIKQNTNVIRLGFFEKIRTWCRLHGRRIVKIAVYCNFDIKDLYESHHQSLLQSYGVETIHTSNQGKNYADLKIAIDVLNSMYTNDNIDEFILMSNDKDMTPLLNTLRLNKRKASIITTGEEYNNALCEFADEQIKFEDVIKTKYENDLLVIDIENKFYQNIEEFIANGIKEYESSTDKNKYFKKNYNIEYFLESQSRYYQIMQYEILNMIKNYCDLKKAILYQNKISGITYTGILPSKYKDYFLEHNIIKEQDILDVSKIDTMIQEKYLQYIPKKN
jgi:uncharacterized LabA/DUF88 family protein